MSIKKDSGKDPTTGFKKYVDQPTETKKVVLRKPYKKYEEEEAASKKIPQKEGKQYEPEYTGTLFLGSSNSLQIPGPQGDPGVGVPDGGTTGQVLTKSSGTDYDTIWLDPASSAPETKDLIYNISDQLTQVVSTSSTKTLTYNGDGTLNTVSDTNGNVLKTMVYDGEGKLDEVQVSFF